MSDPEQPPKCDSTPGIFLLEHKPDERGQRRGELPHVVQSVGGDLVLRREPGGRGDLVVAIAVETPTRLDPRQEELLRELAAIRGEEQPSGDVRPAHKSVFGRLRDAFTAH